MENTLNPSKMETNELPEESLYAKYSRLHDELHKNKCTLTDQELLEAVSKAVIEMCLNRKWQMTVPPDMNRDSDMLISELENRFRLLIQEVAGLTKHRDVLIEDNQKLSEDVKSLTSEKEKLREALRNIQLEAIGVGDYSISSESHELIDSLLSQSTDKQK